VSEVVTLPRVLFGLAFVLFCFIAYLQDMRSNDMNLVGRSVSWKEWLFDRKIIRAARAAQVISLAELAAEKARKVDADSQHATTAAAEQAISLAVLAAEKASESAHGRSPAQESKDHDQRIVEAKKALKVEAAKTLKAKAEKARKIKAEKARKIKAQKALKVEAAKTLKVEAAAEELAQRFTALKSNLPFYISKKPPSAELVEHDELAWKKVTKLVEEQDDQQALLYFIKIRSHLDDKEYYKIGITTLGVKERYEKSTQVEVLETVCIFKTELWKAAYLEYHFLREFRLYDGLARSLGEFRPEVRFSGYTEVVRSNSVTMISKFLEQLGVYNKLK
jgi:hypothetical protein